MKVLALLLAATRNPKSGMVNGRKLVVIFAILMLFQTTSANFDDYNTNDDNTNDDNTNDDSTNDEVGRGKMMSSIRDLNVRGINERRHLQSSCADSFVTGYAFEGRGYWSGYVSMGQVAQPIEHVGNQACADFCSANPDCAGFETRTNNLACYTYPTAPDTTRDDWRANDHSRGFAKCLGGDEEEAGGDEEEAQTCANDGGLTGYRFLDPDLPSGYGGYPGGYPGGATFALSRVSPAACAAHCTSEDSCIAIRTDAWLYCYVYTSDATFASAWSVNRYYFTYAKCGYIPPPPPPYSCPNDGGHTGYRYLDPDESTSGRYPYGDVRAEAGDGSGGGACAAHCVSDDSCVAIMVHDNSNCYIYTSDATFASNWAYGRRRRRRYADVYAVCEGYRCAEGTAGAAGSCQPCPPGSYTDSAGQSECTTCEPGRVNDPQTNDPQTTCVTCHTGRYRAGTGGTGTADSGQCITW